MIIKHTNRAKGFTLVEVLVVLALTTLLLGLLFGPIFQTFKMTQRGQAMSELQETSRLAMEQMNREISDAMYIYDTFTDRVDGGIYAYDLQKPAAPAGVTSIDFAGGRAANTYIDLVLPKNLLDDTGSGARIQEPLQPEERVVRYFIGLQDPTKPYINKHLTPQVSGDDNLYVLYRWEFNPFDQNDPAYDATNGDGPLAQWRRPDYIKTVWGKVSNPRRDLRLSVVIPANKYDLMRARVVKSGGNTRIILDPGIRFTPTQIAREALVPASNNDPHPSAGKSRIPTVYLARYGNWTGQDQPPTTLKGSPRIVVYDNTGGVPTKVYDSFQAAGAQRFLTWDPVRGTVDFGSRVVTGSFTVTPGTYIYPIPGISPGDTPVPGSFKLQLTYTNANTGERVTEEYREVPEPQTNWTGPVFSVDYDANEFRFNDFGSMVQNAEFSVTYNIQNNKATDTVYATYQTSSLISVSMNIRKYGPDSQPVGIQLATNIKPRNLFR